MGAEVFLATSRGELEGAGRTGVQPRHVVPGALGRASPPASGSGAARTTEAR
jgi:hypothetical protein